MKFSVKLREDSFTRLLTILSQNNHNFKIRTERSVTFVTFPKLYLGDASGSEGLAGIFEHGLRRFYVFNLATGSEEGRLG